METLKDLQLRLEHLERENAELRQVVDELLRRLYGKKSEKQKPTKEAPPAPPDDVGTSAKSTPTENPKTAQVGHGRTTFPEHLPREEKVTDIPATERHCSICNKELVAMGVDSCERGHIEPVRITIRRYVSKKYGCPDGHEIKTAEGAPQGLVPRAKWTTETYSFVVTGKYGDHMPLDRMEKMLKRRGISLPKSTMSDMAMTAAEKCELIVDQMRREVLAESYIQADETTIDFATEGQPKEVKKGYLWAWRAKEKLVFEFDPSRAGENAQKFLGDWSGDLQVDGYTGYDAVIEKNRITRIGCTAHVRRKFHEADELKQPGAKEMVQLIARLYRIESAIKKRIARDAMDATAADALILSVRRRRSRPLWKKIDCLRKALAEDLTILPKSPLGKAVTYMTNQWATLLVYIDKPAADIDNNAIERAIRPIAIGRKNWMVAGSPRGARAAARLYSIVNVCKALDVDPYAYLSDVLEKISPLAPLEKLTPWAWKKARDQAVDHTIT